MSKDNYKTPKEPGRIRKFFGKIGKFIKGHRLVCIIVIVLIAAGAILSKKFLMKDNASEEKEEEVLTTPVEVMDLQSSISVTGSLAAGETQSVTSTVATGTEVAAVYYEVGDYVEEGSVIVEFDSDDYAEKLAELNAKYNISDIEDAHTLEDYLEQIEDKQAEMAEIQEYLDEWADVYNNLVDAYNDYLEYGSSDSTIASRWSTESSAAKALDDGNGVSISGYESKQEELETIQDEIEELQYKYELEVLNQEYDSTYTKSEEYDSITESQSGTQVVAPFSGYITSIDVEVGNNYTQGNTVFTISNTDSFVVEATVDEYDIASLSEGLSAVVKFDATEDEEFTGTVSYVAVTADSSTSSSSSSGTGSTTSSSGYEVKITLDGTDDRLRVGMTAKASVILEEATDAYAVAYDCVETDSDGNSYVTVVDDSGNETKVTVTLGLESDYYVQIISDEISEGMLVKATASSGSSSSQEDREDNNSLLNLGGGQGGGQGGDMGGQGGAPSGGQGGPGGGF